MYKNIKNLDGQSFVSQAQVALFYALAVVASILLFTATSFAADVFWNTDASGDWNNAANWSTGTVPAVGDNVFINRASANPTVTISSGAIDVAKVEVSDSLAVTGGSLKVSSGASFVSGNFNLNTGALLNVAGAGTTFIASGGTDINNGRFEVTGGAIARFPTVASYNTQGITQGNLTVLSVKDAGSLLDLSSVQNFSSNFSHWIGYTQLYEARNGGTIDLSSVVTMSSPPDTQAKARFETSTGGRILFDSLTTVTGAGIQFYGDATTVSFLNLQSVQGVSFIYPNVTLLSLPVLTTLNGAVFDLSGVTNVVLGALTTISGVASTIKIYAGQSYNFPALTSVNNTSFTIATGGTVSAPNLVSLTASTLTLDGTAQFGSGMLMNIDNTRFYLTNGAIFNRVSATSYNTQGITQGNLTVLSVKDAGSLLDLSSVQNFSSNFSHWIGYTQLYEARNGGTIDLSSVVTMSSPPDTQAKARFESSTSGTILFSSLPILSARNLYFTAQAGGYIDLSELLEAASGPLFFEATGANGIINLLSLCTYNQTTITETNGGDVQHNAVQLSAFEDNAVFGVQSEYVTGCGGASCSTAKLFSYLKGGYCLRAHATAKLSTVQIDIDALALSPNLGLLGFELIHNPSSGIVTGSRLVAIDYVTGNVTLIGAVLSGREIRAAGFLGDFLYAIDTNSNELLEISPSQGLILGAALPITLNSSPLNITSKADLAINLAGEIVLTDQNKGYKVDRFNGVATQYFIDTLPLASGALPEYSGLAFGADSSTAQFELYGLNTELTDQVLSFDNALVRSLQFSLIPSAFDGTHGDLASVSTIDTNPPGPVTITINPNGDGTEVFLDWSAYNEQLNGADIHHYTIYKSNSSFTNTAQAIEAGQTLAGTKTFHLTNLVRNQQIYLAVTATDLVGNVNNFVVAIPSTPNDVVAPAEVSNISVTSGLLTLGLSWIPPTSQDLSFFKVYQNGILVANNIPANTPNSNLINLTPATGYSIRVTTNDGSGNESQGATILAATYLNNPSNVNASGVSSGANVSWSAAAPANLVSGYKIYAETTQFNSIVGLTPKAQVSANTLSKPIAGLQNGVSYYIAVTAVNISNGENPNVQTVTATPTQDLTGPTIGNATYNGAPLNVGAVIGISGEIAVSVTDPSGISRVEFKVQGPLGTNLIGVANQANPNYKAFWNITSYPNGNYTLLIEAFDTLSNSSLVQYPVQLLLSAPLAPVITVPQNGTLTAQTQILVQGTAALGTTVSLLRNGQLYQDLLPLDAALKFSATVSLVSGANIFTARAINAAGQSPLSAPVTVTLDDTIPVAPSGLSAFSLKDGKIKLTWNAQTQTSYDLYRSNVSFTDILNATKVNSAALSESTYTDLPVTDGTYYYRVVARSSVGTLSLPSSEVVAQSDRVGPSALSITYSSSGPYDPESDRFGPGIITVDLETSEPLLTNPFLSYAFTNGVPISVPMALVTPTLYRGVFQVNSATSNGLGQAVFSARDVLGNQGSQVLSGSTISIDTLGPKVIGININPVAPIKNDSSSAVSVSVEFELSEAAPLNLDPSFSYTLSNTATTPQALTGFSPVAGNRARWSGSFILPTNAGQSAPETLSFQSTAQDDLGNIESQISILNAYQVYQGNLPPLSAPTGLTATALPAGEVSLTWSEVTSAFGYQLFRQAPNESTLTPYGSIISQTEFTDDTSLDGSYLYAIASVRSENGQQSVSGPSQTVSVTADSVAPNAPQTLTLSMSGQGVVAQWQAPIGVPSGESIKYKLYRANVPPGTNINPQGLTPVINNIIGLAAIDAAPSELEHAYAVSAVDAAGNESLVSNTEYLNFALLPVSTLSLKVPTSGAPLLEWSYTGASAQSFRVELEVNGVVTTVYQGTQLNFSDLSYDPNLSAERRYTVYARDAFGAESVGRSILLPDLNVTYPNLTDLKRGIFNRLDFILENRGQGLLSGLIVSVTIDGIRHQSQPVTLAAASTQLASVVVGGAATFSDTEQLNIAFELTSATGEQLEIERIATGNFTSATLIYSLETEQFISGATGRVRFSVENTSSVRTELITARLNGSQPSNELRLKLYDLSNNLYSTLPIQQFLGSSVITVSNGMTVARIEPGATFTSSWQTIDVPLNVPNDAKVVLEVDKIHFAVSTPEQSSITGSGTSKQISLSEAPYFGELISITPSSSFGEPVTITGRARNTATNQIEAFIPLDLVLTVNGFSYLNNLVTDLNGEFSFELDPADYTKGLYTVSIIFPGTLERPNQGQFTLNGINITPSSFQISTPVNYSVAGTLKVSTGAATNLTGVRLEYVAQDQPGQVLPQGIFVTLPAPQDISAGSSRDLVFNFGGDLTAQTTGQLFLRVMATESVEPLAILPVSYSLTSAQASLAFTPPQLVSGVLQGGSTSKSVSVSNIGFAPLLNATVSLVQQNGSPAPWWAYTTSQTLIDRIEIGESRQIDLVFNPDTSVGVAVYNFKLRISSTGQPPSELPISVTVTLDGEGGLLVHTADIYTATLNAQGQPIAGLSGANLRLQHDTIPALNFSAVSDLNGEALFLDVPAGSYHLRGSASGHQDDLAYVQISPGVTSTAALFLVNNVVTVEWSVTEITLEDYYQINLTAVFQTNVPVAVVVLEPAGIQLPDLQTGDTFYGELTLTNYGLINAVDLQSVLPTSDSKMQFEFLASLPPLLEPFRRVYIPYRATALVDFSQGSTSNVTTTQTTSSVAGSSSGSGCGYINRYCVPSRSVCANGAIVAGNTCSHWVWSKNCSSSSGAGGVISGGGGGSSGGGFTPGGSTPPQLQCVPGKPCTSKTVAPDA